MLIKMLKLGKRRIWAVNYSRAVTLPLVWIKNMNLERGAVVEMEMSENGDLIVRVSKEGG
jgi:antitoxin component of MazEF toxin-antitoxin module